VPATLFSLSFPPARLLFFHSITIKYNFENQEEKDEKYGIYER
jgi:hypothetical protein